MPFEAIYDSYSDDNDSICPYCQERYQVETEDYSEDSQEIECDGCGKKYWLTQVFSVSHDTRPDCALNGEEHQYQRVKLNNGREADFCLICDDCRSVQVAA